MNATNGHKKYSDEFEKFIIHLAEQKACERLGIPPSVPDVSDILKKSASKDEEMKRDYYTAEETARKLRKIIVVDPDGAAREDIRSNLERSLAPVFVNSAESGDKALELITGHVEDYSLLICAASMPQPDGFAVLRTLREESYTLPIILMVDQNPPQQLLSSLDTFKSLFSGQINYLVKPIGTEQLIQLVNSSFMATKPLSRAAKAIFESTGELVHLDGIPQEVSRKFFEEGLKEAKALLAGKPKSILVIDRSGGSDIGEKARKSYNRQGFKVITRKYPEGALDVLRNGTDIDLVLSDYPSKPSDATPYLALFQETTLTNPPIPLVLITKQIAGLGDITPPPRTFPQGTKMGDLQKVIDEETTAYRDNLAQRLALQKTEEKAAEFDVNLKTAKSEERKKFIERINDVLLVMEESKEREELMSSLRESAGFNPNAADQSTYEEILQKSRPAIVVVHDGIHGLDIAKTVHSYDPNIVVFLKYTERPTPQQHNALLEKGRILFVPSIDELVRSMDNVRKEMKDNVNPREPDDIAHEHIMYLVKDHLSVAPISSADVSQTEFGGIIAYIASHFATQKKKRDEGLRYKGRFQNKVYEMRFRDYILKAADPNDHQLLENELEALKIIRTVNSEKGGSDPFISVVKPVFPFVLRSNQLSISLFENEGEDVAKELYHLFSEDSPESRQSMLRIYDQLIEQEARLLSTAHRFPRRMLAAVHPADAEKRRAYYWERVFSKFLGVKGEVPFIGSIARVFGRGPAQELSDILSANYGPFIDIVSNAAEGLYTDRTIFNITQKKNSNGKVTFIDFSTMRNSPSPFESPLIVGPYAHTEIILEEPVTFNGDIIFRAGETVSIKDKKIVDFANSYNRNLETSGDPDYKSKVITDIYHFMLESYAIGSKRSLTMFANFMAWLSKDPPANLWYGKAQIQNAILDTQKAGSVAVMSEMIPEHEIMPYVHNLCLSFKALYQKLEAEEARLLNLRC
jgi:CheY-like chemotaxis protein